MVFQSLGFLEALSSYVANGGSPIDFCTENKLKFDDLINWLAEDPARKKRYDDALRARGEWMIQRVLLELKRILTVDLREVYDGRGNMRSIVELSPELASCIQYVESVDLPGGGILRKVKFWDKVRAIELQMKNLSLLIERTDVVHSGSVTVMPEITVDNKPLRFDIGAPMSSN